MIRKPKTHEANCEKWQRRLNGGHSMKNSSNPNSAGLSKPQKRFLKKGLLTFAACMALADDVFAQSTTSPWTQAVQALQTAFTGPIATGFALVSIVVGGLMFAFGQRAPKRALSVSTFRVVIAET